MPDKGLFGGGLFDEFLFDESPRRVRAEAFGVATATCSASAIRATYGAAYGTSSVTVVWTRIRSAADAVASGISSATVVWTRIRSAVLAAVWGTSSGNAVANRLRSWPPVSGLRVMRWGGVR